jgi:predicted nucleotide-binding protein (sugar kinase/HSP70/actin superfamily)
VQGGTFRNPAIHKAMETLLEKPVLCPDISELMGAYGAALVGRDEYLESRDPTTTFIGLDALDNAAEYVKRVITCRGCENRCSVTKLTFPNKRVFYTGNRCERIYSNSGKRVQKGDDMTDFKNHLLFDRETVPVGTPRQVIGIPRTLNMFENYPFWNKLFVESGFEVKLSAPSSNDVYARGAGTIMSENICYPAKLAHGHVYDLIEAGVDRIFYPMVTFEQKEFTDALNSFNCPIVSGYPDVIRSAVNPEKYGVPFDTPAVTFRDRGALKKIVTKYLTSLGVDKKTARRAFKRAVAEQRAYKEAVRAEGDRILARAEAEDRLVVLLLGRPYHVDPLINHDVPSVLTDFGVDVITEDALHIDYNAKLDNPHVLTQWEYPNRYYYAMRWAGEHENVEVVQLNSFGCGPDAIAVDEVHSIAGEYDMGHTVIRIDEIESTGSVRLRLRSMIESVRQKHNHKQRSYTPRKSIRIYQKEDRDKVILAPQFSYFYTAPLVRPILDMGYKMEMLPAPNRETAEVGLKYTNNEICYPAIVVIGDLIKALQSGKYDPDKVAVGITQTGGQCRASSYLSLLRRALTSAGFYNTPIISLTTGLKALNEQPGFKFDIKSYAYRSVLGIAFTDALSELYYATAIREVHKGDALKLADKYMALLANPIEKGGMVLERKNVLEILKQVIDEFNQIPVKDGDFPKVGIIGEIYAKYNAFSNNHVAQWLMDQGLEVISPPLMEFFAAWYVNSDSNVELNLKKPDALWFLAKVSERYTQSLLEEVDELMQAFPYHRPMHNIHHIAEKAKETVHLTHQYGEGWLIPGEISSFMEDDVPNVLCLQPFGCIANHVVAKGVEKQMKEDHPELNLLFLDVDAGVSEVNFVNRLHFFVSHAKNQEPDPKIVAAIEAENLASSADESAVCITEMNACAACSLSLNGESCELVSDLREKTVDEFILSE